MKNLSKIIISFSYYHKDIVEYNYKILIVGKTLVLYIGIILIIWMQHLNIYQCKI